MELEGAGYLYNLSLLAITFAVVSAVVMLLRQTMGGKLSAFDIYLIFAYVSFGFVITIAAVLPPMLALAHVPETWLWPIASLVAAALIAANSAEVVLVRLRASKAPISPFVIATFGVHGVVTLLLVINALVPPVQGMGLFVIALTIDLVNMMWAFVRRVASLLSVRDDWDPTRG